MVVRPSYESLVLIVSWRSLSRCDCWVIDCIASELLGDDRYMLRAEGIPVYPSPPPEPSPSCWLGRRAMGVGMFMKCRPPDMDPLSMEAFAA